MARLCSWQCCRLTLPRAGFLWLLTIHWVAHFMLLALSLALVGDATGEALALWGHVEAFAPACGVGSAPLLLALLGALGACAAAAGLAHAASPALRRYRASAWRRRCMCAQMVVSLQLAALAGAAALAAALVATRVMDELPQGILAAMRCYNKSGSAKEKLDLLQYDMQCCGARSYREWFEITWFDLSLGGPQMGQGGYVSDDVPYSCCKRDILMPCIHHGILSPNPVYKYDPLQDLSISAEGCGPTLAYRVKCSAWRATDILCAFALLQGLGAALARLVQTAVQSAQDVLPPPAPTAALDRRALRGVVVHAWLLGCKPSHPPPQQPPPDQDQEDDEDASADDDEDSLPELGDSPPDEERSAVVPPTPADGGAEEHGQGEDAEEGELEGEWVDEVVVVDEESGSPVNP